MSPPLHRMLVVAVALGAAIGLQAALASALGLDYAAMISPFTDRQAGPGWPSYAAVCDLLLIGSLLLGWPSVRALERRAGALLESLGTQAPGLSRRIRGLPWRWWLATGAAIWIGALLYRAALWSSLFSAPAPPYSTVPGHHPLVQYARLSFQDAEVAAAVAAVVIPPALLRGRWRWGAGLLGGMALLACTLIGLIGLRTLDTLAAALDYPMLLEGWQGWEVDSFATYVTTGALLPVALLLAAWFFLLCGPTRLRRLALRALDVPLIAAAVGQLAYRPTRYLAPGLRRPPPAHLARTMIDELRRPPSRYASLILPVSPAQRRHLRLDDPLFARPADRARPGLARPARRFRNLLLVVLESTGAERVFDRSGGAEMPMPYLHELASRGWWLERCVSASNTSHRSLFAILTGLYPDPDPRVFAMRPDLAVPSLFTFLPRHHRAFFTPGRLTAYFPRALLQRGRMAEVHSFTNIRPARLRPGGEHARNEIDVVDLLLERLGRMPRPFVTVWYTFAPHWEYYEYGERYHVRPPTTERGRYLNNLRLIDLQLRRVVERLRALAVLDETLLVLVGDHGEAFGEHPDNRIHSRFCYGENMRIPALLYSPSLRPQRIPRLTSQVDLLPTILDLLGVPYDPALLQGESLLRPSRRRFVFGVGQKGARASWSDDGIKLPLDTRADTCEAFDLRRDPAEKHPGSCEDYRPRLGALLRFMRLQHRALAAYNHRCRRGLDTFGHRHRGLGGR